MSNVHKSLEEEMLQELLLKECPFCGSKLGVIAYRKRKAWKDCACKTCGRTIHPPRLGGLPTQRPPLTY